MEMGQANDAYFPGLDAGQGHLALGAFTGIKEDTFPVPAKKKADMIALGCGDLAGRAQHCELSLGHARFWPMFPSLSRF